MSLLQCVRSYLDPKRSLAEDDGITERPTPNGSHRSNNSATERVHPHPTSRDGPAHCKRYCPDPVGVAHEADM